MHFEVLAQDIHFSQAQNVLASRSPAFTGLFEGDQRYSGIVRQQWQSVPVPYLTVNANFEQRINPNFIKKASIGVGGYVMNDVAGDGQLSTTQVGVMGSFNWQNGEVSWCFCRRFCGL